MRFSGFEDFDECLRTMTDEEGHDEESARNICGALQAEAKSDHGNVDELRDALERGAGLVADVGVDLVSGVDTPAVNSKWTMLKSDDDGHDYRVDAPILLAKEKADEKRISYAAAMIPRQPDKEGDVVPTPTVEKAAHQFVKDGGGIDTDHSLIDGEGDPVESWVLKEERTFDLPDGGTETYGAGTWMLGVEWGADAWSRIKSGDLSGLSIYGMAEHVALGKSADDAACDAPVTKEDPCWDGYTMVGTKVDENGNEVPNCVPDDDVPEATMSAGVPLSDTSATAKQLDIPLANESVVHLVYESRTAAEKASEEIGLDGDVHEHEFDGMTVFMPGESHDEFVERYMELSEQASETAASVSSGKSETGDDGATLTTNDADTDTMGEQTTDDSADGTDGDPDVATVAASVEELTDTVESLKETMPAAKQDAEDAAEVLSTEMDFGAGDVLDILQAAEGTDPQMVVDAIRDVQANANDGDGMDEDEEDDEEMEASAEKSADEDAMLEKGHTGEGARESQIEAKDTDTVSGGGIPSYRDVAEKVEEGN